MSKLYALYVVKNEQSWEKPLVYSQEIGKLKSVVVGKSGWWVDSGYSTGLSKTITHTDREDEEQYPIYSIKEVPFII